MTNEDGWFARYMNERLHLIYDTVAFSAFRHVEGTNFFAHFEGQRPHVQMVLALKNQFPSAKFTDFSTHFEVSDADLVVMRMMAK